MMKLVVTLVATTLVLIFLATTQPVFSQANLPETPLIEAEVKLVTNPIPGYDFYTSQTTHKTNMHYFVLTQPEPLLPTEPTPGRILSKTYIQTALGEGNYSPTGQFSDDSPLIHMIELTQMGVAVYMFDEPEGFKSDWSARVDLFEGDVRRFSLYGYGTYTTSESGHERIAILELYCEREHRGCQVSDQPVSWLLIKYQITSYPRAF